MPTVTVNGISINYEQQGSGEPLVLIPYLSADHACYAFQVAEYAKHFTCISIDLRGTGASGGTGAAYSTEDLAEDVAGLMQAIGVPRAHVAGLSLGAAVGMWLAAKHPDRVQSLGVHSGWTKSDPFIEAIIAGWQRMATALGSVQEMVILSIFPWCFSPGLYVARPDYIEGLSSFVRSRPAQSVASFMQQTNAVLAHDVEAQLGRIVAPAQITFGDLDQVTSTRFAGALKAGIRDSELLIFEGCAHAPLYEKVEEFNQRTLTFMQRHAGVGAA
jgi:3-oxoadipate enol-lactonase